ncbi:MAG TPA: hypothetical protein VK876_04545 [Rubrivivax sp.]|nr:hypothetical protein [Rubrivivax sp.]
MWFKALLSRRRPEPSERQRAVDLIAAIDRGGLPLNPARVNAIARSLGLEVSTRARVEDTIARIRQALDRQPG